MLAIIALLLTGGTVLADSVARPDIVVFLADDLGRADCPLYGGKDVAMPNLVRLSAEGMTFTHAFVVSPSCAPSRAALLTGLDPMRNGAMRNHSRPRAEIKKWPAYFQQLGYETAAIGKVAHYDQVRDYGFDYVSHFRYHQDDCVEAAVKWLAGRRSTKPLCLLVGTNWPHVPWPVNSRFNPDKLSPPPNLLDTPATRSARAAYAAAVATADRDLGQVYDAARQHLGKNTIFVFSSDHGAQFPFGKWNCYDAGLRTPLVIAWPGEIKPASTSDALVSWIDLLPTLLEAAGGASAEEKLTGRSFLAVLRGQKTEHRQKIFATHSADGNMNRYPMRAVRTRRWKYVRNLDPAVEHHTHIDLAKAADGRDYWRSWVERAETDSAAAAVVRRYHVRPAEELYDLTSDPWELKNVAADAAYTETLESLRAELAAWMKAQGDEGMATERALVE